MIDGTMNFGLLKGKEPSGTGSSICAKQVPTEELIAAIGPAMVPRLGGGTGHPLRDLVGAIETLPLIGWLIVAALILLILKRPENGD